LTDITTGIINEEKSFTDGNFPAKLGQSEDQQ